MNAKPGIRMKTISEFNEDFKRRTFVSPSAVSKSWPGSPVPVSMVVAVCFHPVHVSKHAVILNRVQENGMKNLGLIIRLKQTTRSPSQAFIVGATPGKLIIRAHASGHDEANVSKIVCWINRRDGKANSINGGVDV